MSYLPELVTIATIHLLAVMSPGPDFAMISRSSLVYSRRTGIYAAAGLALGILVHITYSLVGIGLIISQSIIAFSIIKYIGAAYLIYIGVQALRARPALASQTTAESARPDITPARAIWMGFLTNVLNPKATLFFLSVFTQVIDPQTPLIVQLGYGLEMTLATFAWFSLVAILLSQRIIQQRFRAVQHHVERVFGGILIALGIKVALSAR